MEPRNTWLTRNTEWFYSVIYSNDLFYIDYWSFVHLWLGAFLYLLLVNSQVKNRWYKFFIILLSYEILEMSIKYLAIHLFLPETLKDQLMDLLIGIMGGVLIHYIVKCHSAIKDKNRTNSYSRVFISLITALTISYIWVGYYDYSEGVSTISQSRFNWLTLIIWATILFGLINSYDFLKLKIKMVYAMPAVWILLYICILVLELAVYYLEFENIIIKKGNYFLLFKEFRIDIYILLFLITLPAIGLLFYHKLFHLYLRVLSRFKNEFISKSVIK